MTEARWIIEGELELATPLHIGTGLEEHIEVVDGMERHSAWIARLALDHDDRPYLPGTSLKGALRALATRRQVDPAWLQQVFGALLGDLGEASATTVPGLAEFDCAWCSRLVPVQQDETGITAEMQTRVAINRVTGAAEDRKLFHTPLVAPGTRFRCRITLARGNQQTLGLLLGLLAAAPDDPQFRLGAHASLGLGRVIWSVPPAIRRFGVEEAKRWLAALGADDGFHPWHAYASKIEIAPVALSVIASKQEWLPLTLSFHTPFLIKQTPDKRQHPNAANAVPRRDFAGRPILPASSLRGRLGSQAERILRTLGHDVVARHAAPAYRPGSAHGDLVGLLFGLTGWRAVVATENGVSESATVTIQELIAIDRFTGGGKDGAKFQIASLECPTVHCSLQIDFGRLEKAHVRTPGGDADTPALWPALGLLTLVLRDLAEGDIAFGFGVNKGYGQCSENNVLNHWSALLKRQFGEVLDPVKHALSALHAFLAAVQAQPFENEALPMAAPVDFVPIPSRGGFHNPYHFIPLSKPDTANWPGPDTAALAASHHGHARYQGLSGRLVCRLEPRTPLFVGGRQRPSAGKATVVEPFVLKKQHALPATSLRGMISSLCESISGSNFRVLHPQPYSVRKTMEESLSAMGRLVVQDGRLKLRPLTLPTLKIDRDNAYTVEPRWVKAFNGIMRAPLRIYFDPPGPTDYSSNQPYYLNFNLINIKKSADRTVVQPLKHQGRYPGGNTKQAFLIGQQWAGRPPLSEAEYHKIPLDERRKFIRGWVRTLKSPLRRDIPEGVKHHVFLPEPAGQPNLLPLDPKVLDRFHILADQALAGQHVKSDEQKSELEILPYTPLGRREGGDRPAHDEADMPRYGTRLKEGDLVCFDVDENGAVCEISFSSIWRKWLGDHAQIYTTADLLANFDPALLPFGMKYAGQQTAIHRGFSPAELLFGAVEVRVPKETETAENKDGRRTREIPQATAFAGKVRIGYGLPSPGKNLKVMESGSDESCKELSSPKPPCPAFYIQPLPGVEPGSGTISKGMLASAPGDYTLKGRKAYLHAWRKNGQLVKLMPSGDAGGNHEKDLWLSTAGAEGIHRRVAIRPVAPGKDQAFYFEVDFNNLSWLELGQLCAALEPSPAFEHRLGMAKPLGLGSVRIDFQGLYLIDRYRRYADGLSGERYHQVWVNPSDAADREPWPLHLAREQDLQQVADDAPNPHDLARAAMAKVDPDVARAINLFGDPRSIGRPVHYPQKASGRLEAKHFDWFTDKKGVQPLVAITAETSELPTLNR